MNEIRVSLKNDDISNYKTMIKPSPMVKLLTFIIIFSFALSVGEGDVFTRAIRAEGYAQDLKPPINEPMNNDINRINRVNTDDRRHVHAKMAKDIIKEVADKVKLPVNNPYQGDTGLVPNKNTYLKEMKYENTKAVVPTHHRNYFPLKNVAGGGVGDNAYKRIKQIDKPAKFIDENKPFQEPYKKNIAEHLQQDKDDDIKQEPNDLLQFENPVGKPEPVSDKKNLPNSFDDNKNKNVVPKIMTKEEIKNMVKKMVEDVKKEIDIEVKKKVDFDPKTLDQIGQIKKEERKEIPEASANKQPLQFKEDINRKRERVGSPSPSDDKIDFKNMREGIRDQFINHVIQKNGEFVVKFPPKPVENNKLLSPYGHEKKEPKYEENIDRKLLIERAREEVRRVQNEKHIKKIQHNNYVQIDNNYFLKENQALNHKQKKTDDFKSVAIDPSFAMRKNQRSFKILYDETFLIKTLTSLGKLDYLDRIKDLVKRMDIYIDNFLKTTVLDVPKINVEKHYDYCEREHSLGYFNLRSKYFKYSYSVEGDVLVYLYAMDDKNIKTLAAAKSCSYHPNSNEPAIATMRFNIPLIFSENKSSEMAQVMALDTVTHELLHIFGFDEDHSKQFKDLVSQNILDVPNLAELHTDPNNIFDENKSHWSPDILTNDIMTPNSGQDKLLSIFSMEYIEMVNSRARTRRDHLKNNPLLDRVDNFDDYINYKCHEEDEVSKYSNFCTEKQKQMNQGTCDDYFIHVLVCATEKSKNGCYEKLANNKLTCIDESNAAEGRPYESFGDDSRCFMVSNFARCLNTSVRDGRVFIRGSFGEKECLTSGQIINFNFEYPVGSGNYERRELTCPNLEKFTQAYKKTRCMKGCYGNGICKDGVCHCLEGFDPRSHCKHTLNQHKTTTFVRVPYIYV